MTSFLLCNQLHLSFQQTTTMYYQLDLFIFIIKSRVYLYIAVRWLTNVCVCVYIDIDIDIYTWRRVLLISYDRFFWWERIRKQWKWVWKWGVAAGKLGYGWCWLWWWGKAWADLMSLGSWCRTWCRSSCRQSGSQEWWRWGWPLLLHQLLRQGTLPGRSWPPDMVDSFAGSFGFYYNWQLSCVQCLIE